MTDYGIRRYRLNAAVLGNGLLDGFVQKGDSLYTQEENLGVCHAFLRGLDSAQPDCDWGRISLQCRLDPEAVLTVRVFASNQDRVIRNNEIVRIDDLLLDPQISLEEKQKLFTLANGAEYSGVQDMLLMGQSGRWLWIWLEISGEGENVLEDLRVYVPGDNFFRTLPQVYQSDNEFLQRYLSIFSTMFQEFQEKLDALPEILDVDTAPEELLTVIASWMGLEIDEMLFTPDEQRKLLKAAPKLMERKGTKWAIETVVKLFVPENVYIVEYNLLSSEQRYDESLYGKTPYDFTVMVDGKFDEKLRLRLKFLIEQFKPIRSRYRIVFLEDCGGLDAFTYLDVNGTVLQNMPGNLDDGKALTGMTYLE